ncbi:MAG: OmpA family protein [Bacteroidales bacterium]|nr:OmpA family protein [Bacteroidales bacterium]
MIKVRIIVSFIILLSFTQCATLVHAQRNGQELTTKSKKAKKAFNGALTFFKEKRYADAQDYINKALSYDPNFVEAYILQGQMQQEQKNIDAAIKSYKKAAEVNPDFYPKIYYMLATMEQKEGYYADALQDYKTYAKRLDSDPSLRRIIERNVDLCQFAVKQVQNPVPFAPQNIGPNVNSEFDEYINTISVDDQNIIITQKRSKKSMNTGARVGPMTEDFRSSIRQSTGEWGRLTGLSGFNTDGNEGAMSISPDNRMRVYTACGRKEGFGSCDLYISHWRSGRWSRPRNMGANVNTRWWETNSTISSDGNTIFFISNRKGGFGRSDIWKITKQKDGMWGDPVNLGKNINTIGMEMTPYIHPDGKTLYFASDGHIGMGGSDLYVSRMDEKGEWSYPVNLGYPINTKENEMGIVLNAIGNMAYISADRDGGFGGFDVYNFELYSDVRPTAVTYMRGVVRDAKNKTPLEAEFELVNLETGKQIAQSKSDGQKGDFLLIIPVDVQLSLTVERDGYLFYSDNFFVKAGDYTDIKPFLKNVNLHPIKTGGRIVLKNIFFDSRSYSLEAESTTELNKLYELMTHNATLRIEIGGFTDNVGDDKYNLTLSKNRANAVMKFLIDKGINKARLSTKGYGETQPVADNNTEEGRALNRRTEIKVIGN